MSGTHSPRPAPRKPRRLRRTWAQRFAIGSVFATAMVCFLTAAALAVGQTAVSRRQQVVIETPRQVAGAPTEVVTEIALAEPNTSNFLVTGVDNGDCADANDPTVGTRGSSLSDTIMVWRMNPDADQLAVLSFPRDLWVERPSGGHSKINAAYNLDDPSDLIETIYLNFQVPIDHYIQVDLCAFRTLVNAVGGVGVPFEYPAKDPASLLDVPTTGCVNLDGDAALHYVRSRHYRYEDPPGSGKWKTDGSSDFGRIARQQDFVRRVLAKIIAQGMYTPSVAAGLIKSAQDYVVTDSGLTVRRMLEFANTLRAVDPADIGTYRIESTTDTLNGLSIERPALDGDNMKAVLSVFRGEALMSTVSDPSATATTAPADPNSTSSASTSPVTTSPASPSTTGVPTTTASPTQNGATPSTTPSTDPSTTPSTQVGSASTVPVVVVENNTAGIFPDPSILCP